MGTNRRYYHDAYCTQFEATVLEQLTLGEQSAVVLNHTYFFPTSGGQPHDTGQIGACRVVDVVIRETDGAIVHVLDGDLPPATYSAEIDWPRRFDHMQQHTGQHILSRVFVDLLDANTIGFHLSADTVTIDLDISQLSIQQLNAVELLANQIIWENRPIRATIMPKADALQLPLRKVPDVDGNTLRIVEIEGFDWNACGGTHVHATGAVGQIKIVRFDKQRGNLRVEFCCGQRALVDYRTKNAILNQLSANLTCSIDDLGNNVQKMQQELRLANKTIKEQQTALLETEADNLCAAGAKVGSLTIIVRAFAERDSAELRNLGNHISRKPGTIALLGTTGDSAKLVFVRAQDAPGDMNACLQTALRLLGDGKGGGSAHFAQGGSVAANDNQPPDVTAALAAAEKQLHEQIILAYHTSAS